MMEIRRTRQIGLHQWKITMSTTIAMSHATRRGNNVLGRSIGAAALSAAGTWWSWLPVACLPIPSAIAHTALVMVALALFAAAVRAVSAYRGPIAPANRRLMMMSIAVEVPAIMMGTNLVENLGRPDLAMPVVGLVVGVHFLPMARALSYPPYRVLGLAITAFSLVSMALPGLTGLIILGAGTGASLLLTSLHMTLRLRAKTIAACAA